MTTETRYTSARLFPGECLRHNCPVRGFHHQHKSPVLVLAVGEEVTVHDPCGPKPGRVESVSDDGTVFIQGPPLGGGDSRSWRWTLTDEAAGEYVTKRRTT